VEELINRLSLQLSNHKYETQIKLSLSLGYAYHKDGIFDRNCIHQEADSNMYQSKLLNSASTRSHIVKSLIKTLEERDYITGGHAKRLEEIAVLIGMKLKLPRSSIERIALLSKFHDIGKVGIPDIILKKPSSLTENEFKIMKTHTQIGERIASESEELNEIAHLILKHHERWDGSGYPLGLVGTEIPIECRILSVIDAYDAMTNDRTYHKALPKEYTLAQFERGSGSQFDPMIVQIFIDIVKEIG